jgi:hypothetical protein
MRLEAFGLRPWVKEIPCITRHLVPEPGARDIMISLNPDFEIRNVLPLSFIRRLASIA